MLKEVEQLCAQLTALEDTETISPESLLEQAEEIDGTRIVAAEVPGANVGRMRNIIDQLRRKASPIAIMLGTAQGADKVILVAGISQDLEQAGMHAGNWVRDAAKIVDGSGGGKPAMAQAGGKSPEKLAEALAEAKRAAQSVLTQAT